MLIGTRLVVAVTAVGVERDAVIRAAFQSDAYGVTHDEQNKSRLYLVFEDSTELDSFRNAFDLLIAADGDGFLTWEDVDAGVILEILERTSDPYRRRDYEQLFCLEPRIDGEDLPHPTDGLSP